MLKLLCFVCSFVIISNISTPCLGQSNAKDVQELIVSYNDALKDKDYTNAAILSGKIGFSYWRNGKLEPSVEYFKISATLYEDINDLQAPQGVYYSLGLINAEYQLHNEAVKYYQKTLKIANNSSNKRQLGNMLLQTSLSYHAINKTKRAIKHLEEALSISLEISDVKLKINCYRLLADYNSKLGHETKSKKYQENYALLTESLKNEQLAKKRSSQMQQVEGQLQQSELESEAAKNALLSQAKQLRKTKETLREIERFAMEKQYQVNLLNTEKELKETTIKAQEANLRSSRILINSFVIGFILVSALVIVILVDAKKKKVANKKIREQHLNITSSINYAQRIQQAMLPNNEAAGGFLDENAFILFKPRDVVSGDFYWFKKLPDTGDVVIAAIDCTGHGVPGAFMSMVGMNALNGIIMRGINEANTILDALHQEVRTSLSQKETGNNDGMDMALCIIREREKKIEFAGAKNPMVYIQNGETYKIKADVHPIGGVQYSAEKPFTKHIVDVNVDTTVYLSSDGFQDQFGGPNNMKFMTKKFRNLLTEIHQLPMNKQKMKLDNIIEEWMGDNKQTDDILVVGFKVFA